MSLLSQAIDRLTAHRMERWLARIARRVVAADAISLRAQRAALRRLQRQTAITLAEIDDRANANQQHIVAPSGSDWSWRPRLWSSAQAGAQAGASSVLSGGPLRFGSDAAIFTDGGDGQIIARQTRMRATGDAVLFGLKLEVFDFTGTYVSVVLDLPPSAARGLTLKHHLSANLSLTAEADLQCYAVLNLASGPNKERLVAGFRPSERAIEVPFDLSKTHFDPNRLERLWVELIFEPKPMNALHVQDLTLYRSLQREI